jgi:hypothetical protein
MSIHALDKKFLLKEIAIDYRDRPKGSESKLNTVSDGFRVLNMLIDLFKNYKPMAFFSIIASLLFILGLGSGIPVICEFIDTRYVSKVPSAILAVSLIIISILSLTCGFILDTIAKNNKMQYEMYLNTYKQQIIKYNNIDINQEIQLTNTQHNSNADNNTFLNI